MTSEVEEARSILSRAALSLPPPHAIRDLLSSGVCVRCIFRFFGVRDAYSCSILSSSLLHLFLEEEKEGHSGSAENGLPLNGLARESDASQISESDHSYCSICLGILQLACHCDQEIRMCEARDSVEAFTAMISEVTKGENHQIDGFSLEVSIPPIIVANERALRLYLKRKYNCEEWFKDKFPSECISVKDALRLSITKSLEKHLDVKSGVNSVRIQLMYTHFDSIAKLQLSFGKERVSKRRKSEDGGNVTNYAYGSSGKDSNKDMHSEFDAAILRSLNSLEDDVFIEHFASPPDKVSKPCQLTVTCCRMPVYIRGRYLKFSRKVSQSCWMIDDERMGEASIEEIVGNNTLSICRGDGYKFHAAGREDIDVRMLGSGRPFLVEVINARCMPSMADIQQIADTINNFEKKYVRVKNLEVVGSEAWTLMREGEAEKQKQYAALVWISRPLTEQDLQSLSSIKNMEILQRTPIRVLHRRSPLERQRMIHWMMVEEIAGNCQYFLLHLCTQAGTYIKEFVHGDLGRTHPSIGSILGCRAEILQLDVTDVKMDTIE